MDWREWFDEVQAPLGAIVIEERHDEIGPVQVIERGGQRLMYFNTPNCQGRGWKNMLEQPASEYHPSILLSAALPAQINKALVLGLGAGALPAGLIASYPHAEIHAVELRGVVAEISYELFGLPRSPQLHVHVEDAAEYLRHWEEQAFDLIMVDLALGEGVSPLLLTKDFWSLCTGALAPGGVLSANLWQGEQHSYSMIASLMRAVSPQGLCWLEHRSIGNIVLSSLPKDFEAPDFLKRAVAMSGGIRRDLLPLGHQIYRQIRREQHLQESPGERTIDLKDEQTREGSRDQDATSRSPSMVWRSQPTRPPSVPIASTGTPTPAPTTRVGMRVSRKSPRSALLSARPISQMTGAHHSQQLQSPTPSPQSRGGEGEAAQSDELLFPLVTPESTAKREVSDDAITALMAEVLGE